jgi:hypothetical protein
VPASAFLRSLARSALAATILACVELTQLGTSAPVSNIRVTFLGCAEHRSAGDVLSVIRVSGVSSTTAVSVERSGVESANATIPSGIYIIAVGSLPCVASKQLAVLPGFDRNVFLVGGDVLHLQEGTLALAGTLPANGLAASAQCTSPTSQAHYDAEIEGSAYYFDSIGAHMKCLVTVAADDSRTQTQTVLGQVTVETADSAVLLVRNITWADMLGPNGAH